MANNSIYNSKSAKYYDRNKVPGIRYDTATQIGIVKDNLSPAKDGRLRVWIPDFGGDENDYRFWRTVSYANPYMGSTYQPESSQNNNFKGVPHTYGMWAIPPDVGNQVLCTFVNGDPERGFWFACVQSGVSNWMTPAVGTSSNIDKSLVSDDIKASILPDSNVPPQVLPVVEFNENIDGSINSTFFNNKKPVHEFQANILFRQGLDRDPVRGAITSSAQRESPSHVFGISTPGRPLTKDPADDPDYISKVESGNIPLDQYSVPTRKGGHTFVMDDGDSTGSNQVVRLRTAFGHQILMSDDQKVMYISHMDGSSWVEIDSAGIKIYTAGDFSVRSEGTFNLHADKGINIQSGGTFNLACDGGFTVNAPQINLGASETLLAYGAKTSIGAGQITMSSDSKLLLSAGGSVTVAGSQLALNSTGGGNSISMPTLQKNKLADTTFDDQKTKLWYSVPDSVDTVVELLPSHEPWTRAGATLSDGSVAGTNPAPLTKSVSTSVCAPKTAGSVASYTLPAANGKKGDNGKVNGVPTPWSTDTAFISKVKSVAQQFNANYIDMLACMANETGATFDPGIQNSIGATGLIQFMKATATDIGTTTDALKALSRVDQMDWVAKFFTKQGLLRKAPTPKLQDLYLCIYWPAAVGKPDDFIVNPAGSKQAQQNKSLQASDGSITCASVGAAAAKWLPVIQQALANAGETSQTASPPAGVLTSGSGKPVTDSNGNPVSTGSADQGIFKASGQAVQQPTCPAEYLAKSDTYTPANNFGAKTPNISVIQAKAMMAELGYFLSQFDYSYTSSDGKRIGKYAVDAKYLATAGYIKPDAIKQYGDKTLSNNNSWTGRDGINSQSDFFNSPVVQDTIQFNEFTASYAALLANGAIKSDDDVCTAAGMMFVMHEYRTADATKQWRADGMSSSNQMDSSITGFAMYNHGRYAVDVLAAGGATASAAQAVGLSGPNTTGINPDDVFIFTNSGTSTRSNFDQMTGAFKDALLRMAKDYVAKKGGKITITSCYRSPQYQQKMYDEWIAAGGNKTTNPRVNTPDFGPLTTPVPADNSTPDSHGSGVAIDSGQSSLIASTVDLASYGLRWGGAPLNQGGFKTPDPVHIQLIGWAPK
jgi:hypothetical protein